MRRGNPNLATQLRRKALQTVMVEMSEMGTAYGHRVKRSTIVK